VPQRARADSISLKGIKRSKSVGGLLEVTFAIDQTKGYRYRGLWGEQPDVRKGVGVGCGKGGGESGVRPGAGVAVGDWNDRNITFIGRVEPEPVVNGTPGGVH
jgi:hypothetical protein